MMMTTRVGKCDCAKLCHTANKRKTETKQILYHVSRDALALRAGETLNGATFFPHFSSHPALVPRPRPSRPVRHHPSTPCVSKRRRPLHHRVLVIHQLINLIAVGSGDSKVRGFDDSLGGDHAGSAGFHRRRHSLVRGVVRLKVHTQRAGTPSECVPGAL